ncbi:MAG: class I SAM-dependent methyltransferase [Dehalococcoidales bacterium]|jgi:SAM-dependent methyltransferase
MSGGGFKPGHFALLAGVEEKHFWFKARNRIIAWAVGRYFPDARTMLEIGCGTGIVLANLEKEFPGVEFTGVDLYPEGLKIAAARVHKAKLINADCRTFDPGKGFDAAGAFDVLEHIQDDDELLRQMHKSVKPGGGVIITVPQHPFLWSKVDEFACHVRRYRAKDLQKKMEAHGFNVVRKTSFVFFLMPAVFVSRLMAKFAASGPVEPEFGINPFLNRIFEKIAEFEGFLIRRGLDLPFGSSLLMVARRG